MSGDWKRFAVILTVSCLVAVRFWASVPMAMAAELDLVTRTEPAADTAGESVHNAQVQPVIRMNIADIGKVSGSFSVGKVHTWIIRSDIPADIGDAIHYKVTQTIDHCLDYEKFSATVKILLPSGEELPLKGKDHFILTELTTEENGKNKQQISVSLTNAGQEYISVVLNGVAEGAELRVRYRAAINANADMGLQILGQAQLAYTNALGEAYGFSSEKAVVYTGGLNIVKMDPEHHPLQGATFMIARAATETERADWSVTKELLDTGDEELAVIYEAFYGSEDMHGEKVFEATTDENGQACIYGLAYGSYYLVETKPPQKYNLPSKPILVEINEVSHLTKKDGWKNSRNETVDNTVCVINTKAILPETGGMGTAIITASGFFVVVSACLLILINHRKTI